MNPKQLFVSIAVATLLLAIGCRKEAGSGGNCAIQGRLWVRDFNSTFTQLIAEYPGEDTYVYIVYGSHYGYDERIKTDYKGEFEFTALYPGEYTIYAYSADSTLTDPNNNVAVLREVTIEKRKEVVDLGNIVIYE
jgi:hypothetical protein